MQQKQIQKNAAGIDTSKFAKKVGLASLKPETDKFDIGKLETNPVDFKKISDIVDKEAVKKDMNNELVKKVNAIQAVCTSLVQKTECDTKIGEIEKRITDHDHNNEYITT